MLTKRMASGASPPSARAKARTQKRSLKIFVSKGRRSTSAVGAVETSHLKVCFLYKSSKSSIISDKNLADCPLAWTQLDPPKPRLACAWGREASKTKWLSDKRESEHGRLRSPWNPPIPYRP